MLHRPTSSGEQVGVALYAGTVFFILCAFPDRINSVCLLQFTNKNIITVKACHQFIFNACGEFTIQKVGGVEGAWCACNYTVSPRGLIVGSFIWTRLHSCTRSQYGYI